MPVTATQSVNERKAEQVARANDHVWHSRGGAAWCASRSRGSSLTFDKAAMSSRELSTQTMETQADVYPIADEQRDERAARPLFPAGARFGFDPTLWFRPEPGGFTGATPPASGLVRRSQSLSGNFAMRSHFPRTQTASQASAPSTRFLRPSVFASRASSNKSPEPTTTSGTVAAEPLGVPAAVVAHL